MPFDAEALLAILCSETISRKIAFSKTEVVDSIKQIGFAHTISAANANNIFSKIEFLLIVVFELENRYRLYEKTQTKGLGLKV